jgi:hypothetical protein
MRMLLSATPWHCQPEAPRASLEGTFVGQSSRMWEQRHCVNHPRMAHLQEHHHGGQHSGTATHDESGTHGRSTARGGVTSLWRWSRHPQENHYSKAPFSVSLCLYFYSKPSENHQESPACTTPLLYAIFCTPLLTPGFTDACVFLATSLCRALPAPATAASRDVMSSQNSS